MTEPRVERPDMGDYGVPLEADGALPWTWARDRLVSSHNYWLATADATGRPQALPVWGVWQDDDSFAFTCGPRARKLRNIRANPWVVVTTEDAAEAVSVEGLAREITGSAEVGTMVARYVAKYGPDDTELADFLRQSALVQVQPRRAFGMIEHEPEFTMTATRWSWPG